MTAATAVLSTVVGVAFGARSLVLTCAGWCWRIRQYRLIRAPGPLVRGWWVTVKANGHPTGGGVLIPSPRFPTSHGPISRLGTTSSLPALGGKAVVIPVRRLARHNGGMLVAGSTRLCKITGTSVGLGLTRL